VRRGIVRFWLSRKPFSHLVVFRLSSANPAGAPMNEDERWGPD
jgi:hypothetical protein